MRSALFLAYHYPPMRSPGVERSLKFVRYLPEFGYRATVVSTCAYGTPPEDDGVMRPWEPLRLYRRVFNPNARPGDFDVAGRRGSSLPVRVLSFLRRHLLVPDAQIMWIPFARRHALGWLRRNDASLIYSSSPPASAHLLARQLKQHTGLPWVADFRDAWTYDPLDPALARMRWRLRREKRMEGAVVEDADVTIAATEISAEYLRRTYPRAANRIQVIPNGFDPEDIPPPQPHREGDGRPMRIVHTGSFGYSHPDRSPAGIFEALRRLVAADAAWAGRVRLVLVGRLTPDELDAAGPLVESGVVELSGPVERPAALSLQRGADALLLVDHARPWPASNVPGKFYEYLAMERPILALCGPGMVERLMGDLDLGECARPGEPGDVCRAIEALHGRWLQGELRSVVDAEVLGAYERRRLAGRLARCFDDVLSGTGQRGSGA